MSRKNILRNIYHTPLFTKLIPTTVSLLQKELNGCNTVLDLGCGADSPIQYCDGITESTGVDGFEPYLNASHEKKIHTKYIYSQLEDVQFPEKSFDAVIMIDVIEHMKKKNGLSILDRAEKWARKKVILVTPNGFIDQGGYDHNPLQKHLSGWTVSEFEKRGYSCHGLAGLKSLRKARTEDTKDTDLTTSIKYHPVMLWFAVATLSQLFTYHVPGLAFSLFCVKNCDT